LKIISILFKLLFEKQTIRCGREAVDKPLNNSGEVQGVAERKITRLVPSGTGHSYYYTRNNRVLAMQGLYMSTPPI